MELDLFKQNQLKDFLEYMRRIGKRVTYNEFQKAKFNKEDIEWAYENLDNMIADINKEIINKKENRKVFKSEQVSKLQPKVEQPKVDQLKTEQLKTEQLSNEGGGSMQEILSKVKKEIDKYKNKYISKEDIKAIVKEVLVEEFERFLGTMKDIEKSHVSESEEILKSKDSVELELEDKKDVKEHIMYHSEKLYFEFKEDYWVVNIITKSGKISKKKITPDAVMILFDIMMDLYENNNTTELTYNDINEEIIKFYNIKVKVENFSKGKTRKLMHQYYYYPLKMLEMFQVIEHKNKKIKLFNKLPRRVIEKWAWGDLVD